VPARGIGGNRDGAHGPERVAEHRLGQIRAGQIRFLRLQFLQVRLADPEMGEIDGSQIAALQSQ
jgi:hypothetical protein